MSAGVTYIPDVPLPTLTSSNASLPPDLDANQVARSWFSAFSAGIESQNAQALVDLFVPDSFWRDILAFTWDFRTFRGQDRILQFLKDQLPVIKVRNIKIRNDYLGLQQPYPDLAWVNVLFDFETQVGICLGIVRLVPTQSAEWKAHLMFTNLEGLKGFPESIDPLRDSSPNHGFWEQRREKAAKFDDGDPTALIIGAGHSGLMLSARLNATGVSSLVVDKNARVGDSWRNRYETLCLHNPVWHEHLPYMPFPSTWPVYTPAHKLANWLEHYAEATDLAVWLSINITQAFQDKDNKWHVTIRRGDGTERHLIVNHLIFATGIGGKPSRSRAYQYPGLDRFRGKYFHSSEHHRALDYAGKKVVIVGSGTSAHDIAHDCYNFGLDVTMVQRGPTFVMSIKNGWDVLFKGLFWEGGPPVDIADRIRASFPNFMGIGLTQRRFAEIAKRDKELLDGLRSVGFKLTEGIRGTGFTLLAWNRAGGYHLDTGTSQLLIDKKIKLKNDSTISEITETGLKFANGSELPADVIIFATGFGDGRDVIREVCGDGIADKVKPLWGLDEEGEIKGTWRDTGVPNMWSMMGNLALCRFHSKHVALQIKAIEEGTFSKRYSLR